MPLVAVSACLVGAVLGGLNGALVAYVRIPSIVVSLATMVALRDGLRWATDGAWIQDLPPDFQWLGPDPGRLSVRRARHRRRAHRSRSPGVLRHLAAGRAVYATGSNREAARLAGLHTAFVTFAVFALAGGLTGLAALLNSVRFNQIPSNAGLGLELKVIAAVVVGGTAISGGRGSIAGTVLGVILLGAIGPALTFLGVSAYWERAIQGAIILAAVAFDALRDRPVTHTVALRACVGAHSNQMLHDPIVPSLSKSLSPRSAQRTQSNSWLCVLSALRGEKLLDSASTLGSGHLLALDASACPPTP